MVTGSHWLSDLIIYRITELLTESDSHIYVFYYNFITNTNDVVERLCVQHPAAMPNIILLAINVASCLLRIYAECQQ